MLKYFLYEDFNQMYHCFATVLLWQNYIPYKHKGTSCYLVNNQLIDNSSSIAFVSEFDFLAMPIVRLAVPCPSSRHLTVVDSDWSSMPIN